MSNTLLSSLAIAALSLSATGIAVACTTAVYNNGNAALSVRTMDWFGHDDARVVGDGAGIENTYADTEGAITTTSKYASLKIESFLTKVVAESMNEEGLEARMLYLGPDYTAYTSFPKPTDAKTDVDVTRLAEWAVDNFATVPQVVEALQTIDVINTGICGLPPHNDMNHCSEITPAHFQFADRAGNTAVVEFVRGEIQIFTEEEGTAYMSNDPEFAAHLILDKEQTAPGATIRSYDRRLRAKAVLADMYARNVTDNEAAKLSIKGAGATIFAGYDQIDPFVNDVFPTLWTIYTDRNELEWVLDRYDTWNGEIYNFTMFDTKLPERQELGIHPSPKYQGN